MIENFDFIVIGSGPGGYIAAIRASQLGYKKIAIIEKEKELGGVCLNWGCIPTKALLKVAEVYTNVKKTNIFGIRAENYSFDINQIVSYSRSVVKKLTEGVDYLMKKNNIKVYQGWARLKGNKIVEIQTENNDKIDIYGQNIIIATGVQTKKLPNLDFDENYILNAKSAMIPKSLPKSILIIGSGAIGIEFASFYNALGTKVSIIEIQDKILPLEDEEISMAANNILTKKGIKIYTKSTFNNARKKHNHIEVNITHKNESLDIEIEKIIVAIGVTPNTENLGLENTKIKTNNSGFIETDDYYATNEQGIYAIGDITGPPCLAHKASHEAIICVDNIAKQSNIHSLKKNNIPSCIYSIPQIASIGLTEKQALLQGYNFKVGKYKNQFNGKSIALNETDGFIKILINKETGEILGAHMIGTDVTELLHSISLSKNAELTDQDIRTTIFPHPTLSEMIHETILNADNESLNS